MMDNWKELAHEAAQTNKELRDQLKQARKEFEEERRLRFDAEMRLFYAREKLHSFRDSVVPVSDGEYAECPTCCMSVVRDDMYCRGCGARLAWEALEDDSR